MALCRYLKRFIAQVCMTLLVDFLEKLVTHYCSLYIMYTHMRAREFKPVKSKLK